MSEETKKIITVALLVFAAAAWLWPLLWGIQMELEAEKKRGDPPDYDERQKLARQRAGNHTLYALLGFLLVWTAADQVWDFQWTRSTLDMTVCGLLLAWCVWASDCILHDAFVTWKDKRKDADALAFAYTWVVLFWTCPASSMELFDSWVPFIFGCVNTAILVFVVIFKAWKRKKAEAEEML